LDVSLESVNSLLLEKSLNQISKEFYQEVFDFPVKSYYEKIGFSFDKEPFESLAAKFIRKYYKEMNRATLQKNVEELFKILSKKGFNQVILSAMEHTSLLKMVSDYNISHYFSEIEGVKDFFASGKVETGKKMIEKLSINLDETIFIGDTTHDVTVANAIGVESILFYSGHQSLNRLEKMEKKIFTNYFDALWYILGAEKYICPKCSYIYNPKTGHKNSNIEPWTLFEEIPEDWKCPFCGVEKNRFELY
ncbi:HAD hydrolase-like protein, partial [bacterium]|nr:HAD hydrolase-like protein [bacterium]